MKRVLNQHGRMAMITWIVVAVSLAILIPVDGASGASEKRSALVIGNGAYPDFPLKNPINDARDLAYVLKKLGFSVTTKINANHRSMRDAIHQFGDRLRAGGVGLFYYAGHGVQVDGINYLLPIDADIRDQSDIPYESIDAGRILSKMEQAKNKLNIIILDACRNNPFRSQFRSLNRGLAKMDAPTGSILAYSTAPGSVAADGEGRNGLYTSKLLKYINNKGVSIENFFKKVRIEVMNASANRQVPWESSSLTVDFYFAAPKQAPQEPEPVARQKAPGTSADILFWESIKGSNDIRMYQEYLRIYPNGTFASLAQLKIKDLTDAALDAKISKAAKRKERTTTETTAAAAAVKGGSGRKLKLAILPWKPVDAYWNAILMDAIEESLRNTRRFEPVFSFYKMDKDFQAVTLTIHEILSITGGDTLDALWQRSSENEWQPNVVEAMEVANHLGVDALLTCQVGHRQSDGPNKSVAMYLIDAWSGDTHVAEEFIANFDENCLFRSTQLGISILDRARLP